MSTNPKSSLQPKHRFYYVDQSTKIIWHMETDLEEIPDGWLYLGKSDLKPQMAVAALMPRGATGYRTREYESPNFLLSL